jgi:hypothetical protein
MFFYIWHMEQTEPKKRGRNKKPDTAKKKAHQIYTTDAEWSTLNDRAKAAGMDVSPYIVEKALI